MTAPVAVALDAPDIARACQWARAVAPHVSTLKVGLQLFLRYGAAGVREVQDAAPQCALFLDLKLHDIPNTVDGAAHSVADLAPKYLTVHTLGGADVIAAAVQSLPETKVAGVTLLTSMSAADLVSVGIVGSPTDAVLRLATLAVGVGARALICSPQEVAAVRAAVGPDITLITPGVRPHGSSSGDQTRTATPEQALNAGADLLVIGRPITAAVDPTAAAAAIGQSLDTSVANRPA